MMDKDVKLSPDLIREDYYFDTIVAWIDGKKVIFKGEPILVEDGKWKRVGNVETVEPQDGGQNGQLQDQD